MAWLLFVDTSRRTEYVLILGITCVDAALALYVTIFAGLGLAAAGLIALLGALLGATWYARWQWRREEARTRSRGRVAVRIRHAR
jgi:cbb3-type cytochrome oxidase subunit 3